MLGHHFCRLVKPNHQHFQTKGLKIIFQREVYHVFLMVACRLPGEGFFFLQRWSIQKNWCQIESLPSATFRVWGTKSPSQEIRWSTHLFDENSVTGASGSSSIHPYKPSIIQEQQKIPPPSNPKRKKEKHLFTFLLTHYISLFKDLLFRYFQRHPKKITQPLCSATRAFQTTKTHWSLPTDMVQNLAAPLKEPAGPQLKALNPRSSPPQQGSAAG